MSNVLKYSDCESSTYECQLAVTLELYVNYDDRSTLTDTTMRWQRNVPRLHRVGGADAQK